MKYRIFTIMLVILLVVNIVYSAEPTTIWDKDRPDLFDYSNPDSKIDSVPPDKLDLDKVDMHNRHFELTEEQIARNLPKIKDLSKLDETKLNIVIKKQEWGKDKTLRVDCNFCTISSDGTFKNGVGGAVVQLKDYPAGTTFVAKKDGGIDILLRDDSSIDLAKIIEQNKPVQDLDFGEGAYRDDSITIKGKSIKFSDNSQLHSGALKIVNEKTFVIEEGAFTTKDNIIVNSYGTSTAMIFSEIKKDESIEYSNYVQFDRKNKQVLIQGDKLSVQFGETNPYINIKSDAENFEVGAANGGAIIVKQFNNKAPTISLSGPSDKTTWATVKNGQYSLYLGKFGVLDLQYSFVNVQDPTPVEIFVIGDNKLSTISKDLNQYKIVFNEAGELKVVDYDVDVKQDGTFDCPKQKCEIPLTYLMHAGTREDIKRKYKIEVVSGTEDDLKKLKENLDQTSPEVLGKIKRIVIVADASEIGGAAAAASPSGLITMISGDLESLSQPVLAHENSHINTFTIIQKDRSAAVEKLKNELVSGKITKEIYDFELSKLNINYLNTKTCRVDCDTTATFSPFVREWTKAAGDVYGKTIKTTGYGTRVWNDEPEKKLFSDYPKHGCVKPYGCTSFYEDVATYVEILQTDKSTYEIKNSLYKDQRMQQKVYLLLKYGLITQEQYQKLGSPQPIP